MDLKQFLEEIKNKSKHTKNKIVVGYLDEAVIKFLENKNIPVHTKEIYINHKGLSHLARESKIKRGAGLSEEDILKIPDILQNPSAVFLETTKAKMNLLYCEDKSQKCIKIVIDTKFVYKSKNLTLIKTAGYIKPSDLKNSMNKLIYGKWNYKKK